MQSFYTYSNINLKSNVINGNFFNIIENLNLQKLNIHMDDLYGETLVNKLYNQAYSFKRFLEVCFAKIATSI